MSNQDARIEQLERQTLIDRQATNTLLNKQDMFLTELKKTNGRLDRIEDILQLMMQSINEIKEQLRPKNTEE